MHHMSAGQGMPVDELHFRHDAKAQFEQLGGAGEEGLRTLGRLAGRGDDV